MWPTLASSFIRSSSASQQWTVPRCATASKSRRQQQMTGESVGLRHDAISSQLRVFSKEKAELQEATTTRSSLRLTRGSGCTRPHPIEVVVGHLGQGGRGFVILDLPAKPVDGYPITKMHEDQDRNQPRRRHGASRKRPFSWFGHQHQRIGQQREAGSWDHAAATKHRIIADAGRRTAFVLTCLAETDPVAEEEPPSHCHHSAGEHKYGHVRAPRLQTHATTGLSIRPYKALCGCEG